MKLNVISLFRDSESYLDATFRNLEALERRHDVAYFFYENDSADNTAALLRGWMGGRRGSFVSDTLKTRKFGRTMEPQRTAAMAAYRNRIREEAIRVESEWTLLLDSDVDFPDDLVEQYLSWADPRIAMYTPNIQFDRTCRMCTPACDRPAYYDTFALRDRCHRRGMILSCNPFWDDDDRNAWAGGTPVEVRCAFGGAALVRSDVLARCWWGSEGDCEHVMFAEQLHGRGTIVVMPTVTASTRAGDDVTKPETFEMQRRLLENPLLLRFWTERNRGVLPYAEWRSDGA
jgi:hypothetical protein